MTSPSSDSGARSAAELFAAGRRAEETGDLEHAYSLYRRAMTAGRAHADWLYRLGCVCLKTDRFDEACRAFESGLVDAPGDPRMLTNLGAALDHLGDREAALAAYQRATFHDRAPAAAFHNLGALYAEEGRTEDAVVAFSEAVRREPDADGYCNLGLVLLGEGDLVRALDAFENAVAADRECSRGHYYAGVCLLKRGRYEDALRRFDLVLRLDPGLVRAHLHRGVCLHKLERYKAAMAALTEAEAAFPEDGGLHFQLALTCDALGLAVDARRHYHQARILREDPARS
ncbi:tetratricopeptide repeat protein [bacterium]|nr:tetratricopeptide repeat protein [bacterium]